MTDRLKGTSRILYRVNLGNYQHLEIESHSEYWVDDATTNAKIELEKLDNQILDWMTERGVKPIIVARPPTK